MLISLQGNSYTAAFIGGYKIGGKVVRTLLEGATEKSKSLIAIVSKNSLAEIANFGPSLFHGNSMESVVVYQNSCISDSNEDVDGKFVVSDANGCPPKVQAEIAQKNGAIALFLVYDNRNDIVSRQLSDEFLLIPTFFISRSALPETELWSISITYRDLVSNNVFNGKILFRDLIISNIDIMAETTDNTSVFYGNQCFPEVCM